MLIHEVVKKTGLTRKAVQYYIEQGIIHPGASENGYRIFSESDAEILRRVSVLRRLSLDVCEVKAVLADETGETLRRIVLLREIKDAYEEKKKALLARLSNGEDYAVVAGELTAPGGGETILEKLLIVFPGYLGRMIALHFSAFLSEPIRTKSQKEALDIIIDFLDHAPDLDMPDDVQAFLGEIQSCYTNEKMREIVEATRENMVNIEAFLAENKEPLNEYLAFKASDEYKNHPVSTLAEILKTFHETSGYYDVFIPAMKQLSPAYLAYSKTLEAANQAYAVIALRPNT